ncbi:hypothetical protein EJ05DRAFT_56020 [Pseudovirgaria hyperparasitica]|uniref:Mid2 domain-containing protein n=1 Tax=Pseudovirgaria hyperparasitica TaxID=470096 RepID=A0A6A6W4Z8_9PEZI|nr:uncharacterized protein EJ05DRAFT_56020 [Pseudovirgaria hyperparasitica]KAF2757114.1 hypothetical protein EJ05DRAFT_56020 [Pseudovirgaria hyperparasitica]
MITMYSSHLPRIFVLSLTIYGVVYGQTCYRPDGSESGDTPCQSGDGLTVFCCPSGSTCVADPGPICLMSNGGYLRGSCTAQDWTTDDSTACPKFCLAKDSNQEVERCGSSNNFCCGYDSDQNLCDCNPRNNTFALDSYAPIQIVSSMTLHPSFTSEAPSQSSTLPPSSTPTAASETPTAGSETPGAQTTGSSAPTGSPTPEASASSGLSTGAKVGLGVGIPIGVAFIAVLGWLAWRQRKKTHSAPISELQGQTQQPQFSPYPVEQKPEWMQHQGAYGQNNSYAKTAPVEVDGSSAPLPYGAQGPPAPVHEMPTQQR